eukprot:GGOE01036421.1.p1 GENE.GGOE01036421.1~~GGOE01036421.1.p1  ORF type:complete len:368 (-),score=80.61 GGOE01036421.1:187-1290(-)
MTSFNNAAQHYNEIYVDDELDRYDAEKRQNMVLEQFKVAEKRFESLVNELHIPFLDRKLIRKYFIVNQTEQNLANLLTVIDALLEHKAQTLTLLKYIFEREQIFNVIKVMAFDYGKGKLTTLEVQTKTLQLLYSLQRVTLRIVEGIQQWRGRLTRPYSFEWRGINYIFKIIKDCQFIDDCDLNAVLPLQLRTYPLCSNLASLSLFGPAANTGGQASISITYPMKSAKKTMVKQMSPEFQQRLQRAEVMVFSEHALQTNLTQELTAIAGAGAFLTVLDLRHVIPNCSDGIHLNNAPWTQRLQKAFGQASKKLQNKLYAPPKDPDEFEVKSTTPAAQQCAADRSSAASPATVTSATPPASPSVDGTNDG